MTPAQLADAVRAAGAAALSGLGLDPSVLPHAVSVERPRNPEHGDYASALALQVAGQAGVPPRELAQEIAAKLGEDPEIQSVEIAGPGFLNIRLSSAASGAVAGIVVEQGDAYGHAQALTGQRVNLEFVSANPTGPIHIGGARWAAVGEIRASLAGFGVHFGVYFNEKDLHDRGGLDAALATLRQSGHVYEADGATWVRTTDFGDDKDRVYVRGSGEFTYFGADCAYYLDKRERGFGKIVIILGADHHGYVGRLRAIAACFGDDPDQTLEVLIGQPVNLLRDGQPLRMSKRAGTIVTINDIVDAIGVDAARYALARYSLDSAIDLDLDLWTRRSNDNPVYYVQYAHARIASLLRTAAQAGITRGDRYDPALLTHDRENDLLKALAEFPAVVASAAELRQPHRVARYLEDLSGTYHRFYDACRVLPRDDCPLDETGRARLWLAEAARIVLANGLGLLGVTAPDRL